MLCLTVIIKLFCEYVIFFYSLSLPTTVRRSGSTTIISNGRSGNSTIGQNANRMSTANRNQLDPSPQELPVKDTDRAIDVASAECKYCDYLSFFFFLFSICVCFSQFIIILAFL